MFSMYVTENQITNVFVVKIVSVIYLLLHVQPSVHVKYLSVTCADNHTCDI